MFWGLFGHGTCSGLFTIDASVDAEYIYDLYESFLRNLVSPGDIFMHDNASPHNIIRELGIGFMGWPPYTPDLSPIENLWALLKATIDKLYPVLRYAPDTVATQQRLQARAIEAWGLFREEVR